MIEALWSVEFKSNNNFVGSGIVIFETGRVLGGDSMMTYIGSYDVANGVVSATISVKQYSNTSNMASVVGLNQFTLAVKGTIARQSMTLSGYVVEDNSKTIVINAQRQAELP